MEIFRQNSPINSEQFDEKRYWRQNYWLVLSAHIISRFFLNKKAKKQRNITDNEKKNRPNKTRNLRENLHIVDSKRCKVLKCGTNRTASKKLTIE